MGLPMTLSQHYAAHWVTEKRGRSCKRKQGLKVRSISCSPGEVLSSLGRDREGTQTDHFGGQSLYSVLLLKEISRGERGGGGGRMEGEETSEIPLG